MDKNKYENIKWSYDKENGVGRITLNRPKKLNALSIDLRKELIDGLKKYNEIQNPSEGELVKVVVIDGAGQEAFSTGADISELNSYQPGVFKKAKINEIDNLCFPLIAQIEGYCLGGGLELALTCDFRICSNQSVLGQPEINIGAIPSGGGTQRLSRLVGPSRAKEICMKGESISGKQAEREGIVNISVAKKELDQRVEDFVSDLTNKPPVAIQTLKDVINYSQSSDLEEGLKYELRAMHWLTHTEDFQEGTTAFIENRSPNWTGK
jgi:enoyl-CoA hydratase/carnithine racemase